MAVEIGVVLVNWSCVVLRTSQSIDSSRGRAPKINVEQLLIGCFIFLLSAEFPLIIITKHLR